MIELFVNIASFAAAGLFYLILNYAAPLVRALPSCPFCLSSRQEIVMSIWCHWKCADCGKTW